VIQVFDTIEPGFNPRIIAERSLRDDCGDEDFPNLWGNTSKGAGALIDSDDDEDEVPLSTLLMDQMNLEQENRNRLLVDSTNQSQTPSTATDTPRRLSRNRSVLPADDGERQSRLQEQAKNNPWHPIVKGNLILKQGLVSKRKVECQKNLTNLGNLVDIIANLRSFHCSYFRACFHVDECYY